MKLDSILRHQLVLGLPSVMIEGFLTLAKNDYDWQWALEEVEKGLIDGRTEVKSKGGFIVNQLEPQHHFVKEAMESLQRLDEERVVKCQMYVATTRHSQLLGKHRDYGQDSFIIQCQGYTAIEAGDRYGVLEPGDMMYLRSSDEHRFTSLSPRFSITLSLEEK